MKTWLIIATCLVVTGLVLLVAALAAHNWDFSKLSTVKFETATYTVTDAFSKIHINTEEADVTFTLAEDNTCKVVCYERENARHIVEVQNDTLNIRIQNDKKWYEYICIYFGKPKITVSLPQSQYDELCMDSSTGDVDIPKDFQFNNMDISVTTGDVTNLASATDSMKITTSTGDIRVENVTTKALILSVTTGHTYLTNIRCDTLDSNGNTGDTSLKNVIATEQLSINRSTGDVKLDRCDALEIYVKTDTGDVTGSLLSEKVFTANTSTGKINVPQSSGGGKCDIVTSTGNIRFEISAS